MRLTIVIPTRDEPTLEWHRTNVTLRTLATQTFKDFTTIVVWDQFKKGAPWARNEGFKEVKTELVLFSDDDIEWEPDALQAMIAYLDMRPEASYVYGAYRCNWRGTGLHTISQHAFDAKMLRQNNYISTMSIIRTKDFPGFDECLKRYQDWDLWLTLLERKKVGVFCGRVVFKTFLKPGGVSLGTIPISEARACIAKKHHIQGLMFVALTLLSRFQ